MDLDQLTKRLEWLDGERRKDKTAIATLEERLAALERDVPGLLQRVKEQESEIIRLNALLSRFDQIEANLAQMRVDLVRSTEAIEKTRSERDREADKVRLADMEQLNKMIADVRRGLDPIPDLKKSIQGRVEEDYRLGRLIEELETKLTEGRRSDEEYRRSQKLLEDSVRQEAKRVTDLSGEVAAVRKRQDEQRGKVDLATDSLRKMEMRISEFQAAEAERRQSQASFIDRQNMSQVERDRIWKDWQTRFELIERQAIGLDSQLQSLDSTHRAVKRAQEAFDEITQRFERRINEITEMQRLNEDRFRQEWVTFRADDQKRWTNYSLVQEEQQREVGRQFDKMVERLVLLEDLTQEMKDQVHQITEETLKRLQGLLALSHDWIESYDRTFGRGG